MAAPARGGAVRRVRDIALAEAFRTGGSFNRKTLFAMLVLFLATALITPALTDDGLEFDRGLYRVAVVPESPLLPAVQTAPVFRILSVSIVDDASARRAIASDEADLVILKDMIHRRLDAKGNAAVAALRESLEDHNYGRLLAEDDQAAAFPVRVELIYEEPEGGVAPQPVFGVPSGGGPAPSDGGTGGPDDGPADGGGSSGGVSGTGGTTTAPAPPSSGFDFLPDERSVNTPGTLSPPFPFRSLLLAYAFLIPMNFVVQVYAGSAISERLGRKGEPLLASPARPWEIIVGKALPYFLLMMAIALVIVFFIGGGWLSLLAVAPLAYCFLAMEFVAAMYARSFRELTFLTVFTSVMLTIYAFLPAVFSDVHPIALVSPITLVVFDLRGEAVPLAHMLYSLLPLTLFSTVLMMLGAALYREEDLFHQKPVLAKAVDSVARQVKSLWSAIKIPFLFLPFVFIAELMLVTFLFAWPVSVGMLGALIAVALVEEAFKAIPSYAGIRRGVISPKKAVAFGVLVGVGFFLAEKGFLFASLAGLYDVPAGSTVFGTAGGTTSGGAAALMISLLLLGPLVLHAVTAGISAWGAKHGGSTFGVAFGCAVAIHTAYNFTVVSISGGGFGR